MSADSEQAPTSGMPSIFKTPLLEAYGCKIFPFPGIKDLIAHIEATRNFPIRDDDVLVAAYPRC
ncbi:sulfotransferase 1A1, partial [Biomphalaria pfeifferi]